MHFSNLNDGDWQNLIYLVVFAVIMLAGLLSRRDLSAKQILKYLGIWSLIGLVAVIIYAYRFEFFEVRTRVIGEINPSSAQVNKSGQIIIRASQNDHFYVNLMINGVPVYFMVDTGASDMALTPSDAKRVGIDLKDLKFDRSYQTANGTAWGASVMLKRVELGNILFSNVSASVSNSDMGISLLGISFLKRFRKYEVYQDRLVLSI